MYDLLNVVKRRRKAWGWGGRTAYKAVTQKKRAALRSCDCKPRFAAQALASKQAAFRCVGSHVLLRGSLFPMLHTKRSSHAEPGMPAPCAGERSLLMALAQQRESAYLLQFTERALTDTSLLESVFGYFDDLLDDLGVDVALLQAS